MDATTDDHEFPQDDPSDPITASYDVYIKPHIVNGNQVYILQYPNRDATQPYSENNGAKPLQMRIKPNSGMIELDVPMDAWQNYDQRKGAKWGDAIKKSAASKGRGSHGLPGGFGIGGAQVARARGKAVGNEDDLQAQIFADWAGAVDREEVLVKQTLGGQPISNDDTQPQYMIGTFRNDQLHLTPVDAIVPMRPQFHHIDAKSEQERTASARMAMAAPTQTKAITMSVKSNIEGVADTEDDMNKRIAQAQQEHWIYHKFVDEDQNEAWQTYDDTLFVGDEGDSNEDLKAKLPQLRSVYSDATYLNTISAPRNAEKIRATKKRVKKEKREKLLAEKLQRQKEGGIVSTAETEENGGNDSDVSSTLSDLEDTDDETKPVPENS